MATTIDFDRSGQRGVETEVARKLCREVLGHMRQTRGEKYRGWLLGLASAQLLFPEKHAAELLLAVYAAMRDIDDCIDGDAPLPEGYVSGAEYARKTYSFLEHPRQPENRAEYLLGYAITLMSAGKFDIIEEIALVLQSLRFDALRRNPNSPRIFLEDVLKKYSYRRDIPGVVRACLKLSREHEKGIEADDLAELGEAVQIGYNLRDVYRDWEAGYCNIPLEALRIPELSVIGESGKLPEVLVRRWKRGGAARGKKLLAQYRKSTRKLPLFRRTRLGLYIAFERPALHYLDLAVR